MSPSISVFILTKLMRDISMLLLFVLATSVWGLSKLWGCYIPTSYITHSALRLCRLLLLFNLSLPTHLFFSHFMDHSFHPLLYLLPIHRRYSFSPSKLSPDPHLLSCCEVSTTWTLPTACLPPAFTTCPCALRFVPMSGDVPVVVRSPNYRPWPAPRSLSTPGGYPFVVPLHLCVPALSSPSFLLNLGIIRF